MKKYQLYIDGAYSDPSSGKWLDTVDPYRGETWAQIPLGNSADVSRAVVRIADWVR